jgi:hypothetical protein
VGLLRKRLWEKVGFFWGSLRFPDYALAKVERSSQTVYLMAAKDD